MLKLQRHQSNKFITMTRMARNKEVDDEYEKSSSSSGYQGSSQIIRSQYVSQKEKEEISVINDEISRITKQEKSISYRESDK